MSLEAIDFSRKQAPQPRLSKPYVPGRHASRFWSADDDAVLRAAYPGGGLAACLEKLPERSQSSIYQRVGKLKLKRSGMAPRRSHRRGADLAAVDAKIREAWPTLTGRGAIAAFAASISEDRWWVSKRAVILGLSKAHRVKESNWTEAENALMRRVPLHDPEKSSQIFADHGFDRSPTAIMVRAKRLDLSRRRSDVLSATRAAAILGVDGKWVMTRCVDGRLEAEKRGTARLVQQGGDTWSIKPAALRAFVLDHLEEIDIRKVDKFAFVDLLVPQSSTSSAE